MQITTALVLFTAILLAGCGEQSNTPVSETPGPATPNAPADVTDQVIQTAFEDQTLEVGCASCIYKMAGVAGCVMAVKVGGESMLLSGIDMDAHEHGLCKSSKQARASGKVEGDEFVATKVELN